MDTGLALEFELIVVVSAELELPLAVWQVELNDLPDESTQYAELLRQCRL